MELKKYTEQFERLETPFYFYDIDLLKKTFAEAKLHVQTIQNSMLHLAMKANYNETILRYAQQAGFGIDAVSGGEILRADQLGFSHNKIVFAGVGKTDKEILIALDRDILCFNVESIDEIDIINNLAGKKGKNASLAIRINPNIDAHTHKNITTGLK